MQKKIELLSPAGGYIQFIAAVESGADAVYLGGSAFNARNSASNFSDDELKKAIEYAHLRGVKVHLTLNILLHDSEITEAIEFAKKAYLYGIDAFIVQDIGLVSLIRKAIPDATLHFSTQGTIYSLEGIKALEEFNFERVVLSRELSLDDIEHITKNTNTEIEVFVHGALCICYSGQCRLSSLVGGRSGNRGKCAQPCRLKYSLYENNEKMACEYVLSPKDLCGINDLIRLIKSGVSSLKIEGRLKSPEYVACVTSIYRKYIDLAYELIEKGKESEYRVLNEDIKKLSQVFNRGGFSRGYYYNEKFRSLMSYKRPKHWGTYVGKVLKYDKSRKLVKVQLCDELNMGDGVEIVNEDLPGNIVTYIEKDGKQIKSADNNDVVYIGDIVGKINGGEDLYKISDKNLNLKLQEFISGKFYKRIPVRFELYAHTGQNVVGKVIDFDNNAVEFVSDYIADKALKRPLDFENAKSALSKLGDTPFILDELNVDIGEDALVPMSILNDIRRNLVELLSQKRSANNRIIKDFNINKLNIKENNRVSKISIYLYNLKNLDGLEEADRIYVPLTNYSSEIIEKFSGKDVVPYVSAVTKGSNNLNTELKSILVGNIEHLEIFKNVKNKYCDFSLNAFNSYAIKCLNDEYNVKGVNLSFELNLEEIKKISSDLEKEVTVYGRLPLMISEHCVMGTEMANRDKCGLCQKSQFYLEDRVGESFPLITDITNCRMQVLNSKILFASEISKELDGKVDYFRAYFFDETTEERRKILKAIKNGEKIEGTIYTSGHFYRGV